MSIKKIDDRFATSPQLTVEDVAQLASEGYVAIVCARPDNEEPGQPDFDVIAREAEKHGMQAIHIPMTGAPSPEQIAAFQQAMSAIEGPVVGYCRGGGRASALYSATGA